VCVCGGGGGGLKKGRKKVFSKRLEVEQGVGGDTENK